jgi:putative ABC transport system permease protein
VTAVTLHDLALRNVKKSLRDYAVYFLTLTFGVCLFYIFNSLESQGAMMELTSGQSASLRLIDRIMGYLSAFIACILGFLIIYANHFLIRRRKKEFGVYLMLGLERGQVSRMLVMETVFVGCIALITGLVLGTGISQAMALVTARLLGADISSLRFVFAPAALRDTVIYFSLTFILVLIFNVVLVRRQSLIDLINAQRKNESFKTSRLSWSALFFALSLLCLGTAYSLILENGLLSSRIVLSSSVTLGVLGTFLFFFSLSGFFLNLLQRRPSVYLRNLNLFVLRQINSKINTAYVSISCVCLMLFVSVCTLSSGMGVAEAIAADMRRGTPFDASFSVSAPEDAAAASDHAGVDLIRALREQGADLDAFAGDYLAWRYYDPGVTITLEVFGQPIATDLYGVKLSDYNAVLSRQGVAPITLAADEYALNSNIANTLPDLLRDYVRSGAVIELAGADLRTGPDRLYAHTLATSANWDAKPFLVVPDDWLADRPVRSDVLNIDYPDDGGGYEALCQRALTQLRVYGDDGTPLPQLLETRAQVLETSNAVITVIAYLAIYLGVVFLIASASALAIAQLSETSDNISRYGLLRQIGAEATMINRALFAQILIYFGAPLSLALVHAMVGIHATGKLVYLLGAMNIWTSSLITALVIVLIYGGYFWATYSSSRNMIQREYVLQRRRSI